MARLPADAVEGGARLFTERIGAINVRIDQRCGVDECSVEKEGWAHGEPEKDCPRPSDHHAWAPDRVHVSYDLPLEDGS